jgi:hypothetical protein
LKRKFNYLITILIYLAIYPLLFLLLGLPTLFIILPRLNDTASEPTARPTRRLAVLTSEPSARPTYRLATLPTTAPITTPTSHPAGSAPGPEVASPAAVNASAPAVEVAAVADSAVLPSAGSSNTASSPASPASPSAPASTPGGGNAAAVDPVQPPAIPAATTVQTAVVANAAQAAPVQPAASPTVTPVQAAATPTRIQNSASSNATKVQPVATPRPAQPRRASPTPTFTPVPDYNYMLAEFFNSPTTNAFMVMYVAVVDPREIPIGDMKVVGTRLDKNETYESPLTQWHYTGSSAPGEFIKTGNTKFEPPQGMETTAWVLHLEDAHGNRQSADVPFDVDANDKQWYFIKFRRKY